MSEVYKKAVFCLLVLCFYTNVGKAQSNIARRLEILEHKFAIQAHENALMKEELNSIKLRLSEVENCTIVEDMDISKKSTDIKCCTDNELKTLMENTAEWQRDQEMVLLLEGFKAEKQVREKSEVSFHEFERNIENKLVNLNAEVKTLKSYIKQNFEDSALLNKVLTSEKALQEINAINKELNQTVQGDVLLKIQTMERSFEGLQAKVTDTIGVVDQSLDSINDLTRQEIAKLTNYQQNQHVAFSARLTYHIQHLEPWATLKFNDVIYNDGNGYSPHTGVFTAPRNGVYVFFIHTLGSKQTLELCMQKNETTVLWLYAEGPYYGRHGADSNMIVLDLQKGDTVNVVKNGPYGQQPFYVHGTYSNFSGYILYPL